MLSVNNNLILINFNISHLQQLGRQLSAKNIYLGQKYSNFKYSRTLTIL